MEVRIKTNFLFFIYEIVLTQSLNLLISAP